MMPQQHSRPPTNSLHGSVVWITRVSLIGGVVAAVLMAGLQPAGGDEPTPTPTPCTIYAAADVNGDGSVNGGDILAMRATGVWGLPVCDYIPTPPPTPTPTPCYWDAGRAPYPSPTRPPVQTIIAQDEQDLQTAAGLSDTNDVVIFIDGVVEVTQQISFPLSDNAVTILPGSTNATIRSTQEWQGPTYCPSDDPPESCLSFESWRVSIVGLRFEGYAHFGSLLKFYMKGGGLVHDCTFDGVAVLPENLATSTGLPPPPTVENCGDDGQGGGNGVFRSHVIGAHGVGPLVVSSCHFSGCATTNHAHSHCVYASGPSVSVVGCQFTGCGNPIGLNGYGMAGGQSLAALNLASDSAIVPISMDPGAPWEPAFYDLVPNDHAHVFAVNVGKGDWWPLYNGNCDSPWTVADFNDFADAWVDPVASCWDLNELDWSEWTALGYDLHSAAPSVP